MVLRRILGGRPLSRQEDVVEALAAAGFRASQATVSRDLGEIGAGKVVGEDGSERYALVAGSGEEGERHAELRRALATFMVDMVPSAQLLVVKTVPAGAGPVAATLDGCSVDGIVGTVAGDDTVLVVAGEESSGAAVEKRLRRILED